MAQKAARERFVRDLIALATYFDKELPDAVIGIYWEALKGYDPKDLHEAFQEAVIRCKFMPKVAEIIEIIQSLELPQRLALPLFVADPDEPHALDLAENVRLAIREQIHRIIGKRSDEGEAERQPGQEG